MSAAQAALRDLKVSSEYAGVLAPPKLAAEFMSTHSCLAENMKLKAHVLELLVREEQRDAETDRTRDETMSQIRATQGHLTALGQEVSSLKRTQSSIAADSADAECPEAGPSTKRPCFD